MWASHVELGGFLFWLWDGFSLWLQGVLWFWLQDGFSFCLGLCYKI